MTKAEMQAEIGRLREETAAWRELVIAIHATMLEPYPSTADGPEYNRRWDRNRDLHHDRCKSLAAHMRGIIASLAEDGKQMPSCEAKLIRELRAELAEKYPYL